MDKDTYKTPITLCVVTNSLDEKLKELIAVAAPFFGEILIGYNGTDSTINEYSIGFAHVHMIPIAWEGFSTTKNKLAAMATSNWIWSLDGDEVPDDYLLKELKSLQEADLNTASIYKCRRISFFEGKMIKHGAWGRDRVKRLYHKTNTQWKQDLVHEVLESNGKPEMVMLKGILYHYTADDANSFIEKNKKYAGLSAQKYFLQGKKSPLWKRICSPAFTLIKEYFFQLGLLDGKAGWQIARINALYTYWKYKYLKEKYQASSRASI